MAGKFEHLVEKLIKDARNQGKFNNLANEGKPIQLEEENPYLDEDWRVAYKILKNAGAAPAWVELEKEVEAEIARVRQEREVHRRWLKRKLGEISAGPVKYFARDLRQLDSYHKSYLNQYARKLEALNGKIETFNYHCPVQSILKIKFQVERVVEEFDQSCPAIPLI